METTTPSHGHIWLVLGILAAAPVGAADEAPRQGVGDLDPGGVVVLEGEEGRRPSSPSWPRFLEKTVTGLVLEFQDKSSVELGFRIYRNGVLLEELGPLSGRGRFHVYSDEDLTPNRRYCYDVRAYNAEGESPPGNENCAYTNRPEHTGALVAGPLRILTHNVFNVDNVSGIYELLFADECVHRLETFGETVAAADPAYDLIGVQEFFNAPVDIANCDPGYLLDPIQATGRYLNDDNRYLFKPDAPAWEQVRGGIGVFSLHPIVQEIEEQWSNNTTTIVDGAVQGFVFTRIQIPGTPIAIDFYVLHIYSSGVDGCKRDCQIEELEQLADRIAELSRSSGNPVVIVGDFNIKGPTFGGEAIDDGEAASYDDILRALRSPTDLYFGNHPAADEPGYTYDECTYAPPSRCDGARKRIDYIFIADDPALTNCPYDIYVRNRDDVAVVEWGTGFGTVSDHAGVEATIEIRERVSDTTPATEVVVESPPEERVGDPRGPLQPELGDEERAPRAALGPTTEPRFVRGDVNGDFFLDIADVLAALVHVYGGRSADCEDAADTNDDGALNSADAVLLLQHLFLEGRAPRAPFPAPGADRTSDSLGCHRP